MKKFEYRGKQWHEECFCCAVCKKPIGNQSFIPRDQEVVCVPCYEEHYAQRCLKCNGVRATALTLAPPRRRSTGVLLRTPRQRLRLPAPTLA